MTIGRRMDEAWKRAISEGKKRGGQAVSAVKKTVKSTGVAAVAAGGGKMAGGAIVGGHKMGGVSNTSKRNLGVAVAGAYKGKSHFLSIEANKGLLSGKRKLKVTAK
jgi:hypothetical protein